MPTADAGLCGLWYRQLNGCWGEQAISDLGDRCAQVRYGKSHHRAAVDDALLRCGIKVRVHQQGRDGSAETSRHVLRRGQRLAGERDNAVRQRRTIDDGPLGGDRCTWIDADQPNVCRDPARGDLLPGQDFDDLLFPT